METKSKNKRVGLCLMVGTICIVVAGLWAVLATPETALAKKPDGGGGKETRTYRVTFQDDFGTVAASGCRTMSIINPEDSVAHLRFDSPLDLSGVIDSVDGFAACFPDGAKAGMLHGRFRDKHDPAKVNGILFFPGLDKPGQEIGYRRDYTGTVTAGIWTPALDQSATITLDTWELTADTGGRKSACSGEGSFSGSSITTIVVDRLSECLPPPE